MEMQKLSVPEHLSIPLGWLVPIFAAVRKATVRKGTKPCYVEDGSPGAVNASSSSWMGLRKLGAILDDTINLLAVLPSNFDSTNWDTSLMDW